MTRVHGLLLIVLLTTLAPWLRAGEAVVHAVLFYSPTCPHCHKVIEEHLIPLQEKYGERLAILGINIFRPEGRRLYAKAMGHFGIPDEDRGVPALIVGTALLQGDREIPESFPGIVNQGLILGGIDWPLIAGLQQLLEAQGLVAPAAKAAEAVEPTSSPAVDKSTAEHDLQKALRARPTLADKWARDPVGNSLALAVLAGMLFSIVFLGYRATLPTARPIPWPRWSIPALLRSVWAWPPTSASWRSIRLRPCAARWAIATRYSRALMPFSSASYPLRFSGWWPTLPSALPGSCNISVLSGGGGLVSSRPWG